MSKPVLKFFLGFFLLSFLLIMVVKKGEMLLSINLKQFFIIAVVSFCIHVFNGIIFWCNLASLSVSINLLSCQRINAWSSMANSLGGLPIGVAGKLFAASRIAKTPLLPLVYGQICYTFCFIWVFLLVFFISLVFLERPWYFVVSCALILMLQSVVLVLLAYRPLAFRGHWPILARSLSGSYAMVGMLAVIASSVLMLMSYLYLIQSLSGSLNLWLSLSFISLALLVAMAIGFSGVGGLLELILGSSAWLSGLELMQGVEIGLIVRCAAIISSGAWLLILFLIQKFKA